MKLVSWNVNGLRACMNKGFLDSFAALDADVFCLQETKLQPDQIQLDLPGYQLFWNSAEKKGYSGTALFTRLEPVSVSCDIGDAYHIPREGTQRWLAHRLLSGLRPLARQDRGRPYPPGSLWHRPLPGVPDH